MFEKEAKEPLFYAALSPLLYLFLVATHAAGNLNPVGAIPK